MHFHFKCVLTFAPICTREDSSCTGLCPMPIVYVFRILYFQLCDIVSLPVYTEKLIKCVINNLPRVKDIVTISISCYGWHTFIKHLIIDFLRAEYSGYCNKISLYDYTFTVLLSITNLQQ
jgi:hypothetical protein